MEFLDNTATEPVTDIIVHKCRVVASFYDKSVRLYADNKIEGRVFLPDAIHKLCSHGDSIVCGSATGVVYILGPDLALLDSFSLFPGICCIKPIRPEGDTLFIGSWDSMAAIVVRNEACGRCEENRPNDVGDGHKSTKMGDGRPAYSIKFIKKTRQRISSADCGDGRIAIAFENALVVYDASFNSIFTKAVPCCINTAVLARSGIFLGLINGRILYEDFKDPDESFMFNAHAEMKEDEKILHSVNEICYDGLLYSAGSNGKIIKWDVQNKKCMATLFSAEKSVKKFICTEKFLYAIVESVIRDEAEEESISKAVYLKMN